MQPEETYHDELEYLAQQGFETTEVKDSDLADLKKRIRNKGLFFQLYLVSGSLALGIVIGLALFFGLSKSKTPGQSVVQVEIPEQISVGLPEENKVISLDTVQVVKENFIRPAAKLNRPSKQTPSTILPASDTAELIPAKPLDLSLLAGNGVKEEKLKYMTNAPVFYLHDMKITNYTSLYFKKNRFVKFTGLAAAYSDPPEEAHTGSGLMQSPEHYLHEEIAEAMQYFKKGRYDQAINSLTTVATYNDEDLNCDFYLAMCYYYKKNYNKAIELFGLCITNFNNTFLQEAMYYKALSLYENGNKEEARNLFRKIADEEEFYAPKAKAYLKE